MEVDCFRNLEVDYTHETVDYGLLPPLYEKWVPTYYGSETMGIPVPDSLNTRQAREILMTYVAGKTMLSIDPTEKSQRWRQKIIGAILEAESQMSLHSILHCDFRARNMIVVGRQDDEATPSIRFVDLGLVILNQSIGKDEKHDSWPFPGQYISPSLRATWEYMSWTFERSFKGWIDWEWDPWLSEYFKRDQEHISQEVLEYFENE